MFTPIGCCARKQSPSWLLSLRFQHQSSSPQWSRSAPESSSVARYTLKGFRLMFLGHGLRFNASLTALSLLSTLFWKSGLAYAQDPAAPAPAPAAPAPA